MTLLAEIQGVLERTYHKTGINLEEYLVRLQRCCQLSQECEAASMLSERARIFLRWSKGDLVMALYYSPDLVKRLEEEPPNQILSHRNIHALIAFIEEVTHGIHVALAFRKGKCDLDSEIFYCQLEVQAKIDTYWMLMRFLHLVTQGEVSERGKDWIFYSLFEQESFDYSFPKLKRRYRLANQMARCFVEKVSLLSPRERVTQIRAFPSWNFKAQYRYCFS